MTPQTVDRPLGLRSVRAWAARNRRAIFAVVVGVIVILAAFGIGASESVQNCMRGPQYAKTGHTEHQGLRVLGVTLMPPACWWAFLDKNAEAIIALATIALFVYTAKLWGATQTLAREAKDGSDKTLAHLKETAERQLRAYISVVSVERVADPQDVRNLIFLAKFKNTGATPAFENRSWIGGGWSDFQPTLDHVPDTVPGTGSTVGPDCEFVQRGVAEPWTDADMVRAAMREGGEDYYVYGRAEYRDAFGTQHFTNFCTTYAGRPIGTHGTRLCETGNDAD